MAYHGDEYKMSNYKKKWCTPEQCKLQWEEAVRHETEVAKAHSVNKDKSAEEVLNSPVTEMPSTTKSHTMSFILIIISLDIKEGYNVKLKRDDRLQNVGLKVNEEEKSKPTPILSSSVYGHWNKLL